ncbi:Antilisterial bacteriocin subtilosin biosynthesis protein AlbA [subsurface metagenome]
MELSIGLIKRILNQIRDCGVRIEILGGEPLLRKDIADIIRYAKKEAKVPFISIYTNGINATPGIAVELKAAGLDAAIVTLVSHKKEIHDEFTGVAGSWEKMTSGIGVLQKAGIKVYTFTAVHKYNYRDYKDIYYFVKNSLKAGALFYQYIPQKKNDPLMIDPVEWSRIKHWVLYEKNREHMDFVRKFYMLTGNACSGGNFVITIKVDGSVQPCPFLSDIPLGNIHEHNVWTIFKNRFGQSLLSGFKDISEECRRCAYKSVCGGGCKAGNNELFGRYNVKDHRCLGPYPGPIRKSEITDRVPAFF